MNVITKFVCVFLIFSWLMCYPSSLDAQDFLTIPERNYSKIEIKFFKPDSEMTEYAQDLFDIYSDTLRMAVLFLETNIPDLEVTCFRKVRDEGSLQPRGFVRHLRWFIVEPETDSFIFSVSEKRFVKMDKGHRQRFNFSDSTRIICYSIMAENPIYVAPRPGDKIPFFLGNLRAQYDFGFSLATLYAYLELKPLKRLSLLGGYTYIKFDEPIIIPYESLPGFTYGDTVKVDNHGFVAGACLYPFGSYPANQTLFFGFLYSPVSNYEIFLGFPIATTAESAIDLYLTYWVHSYAYQKTVFNIYGNASIIDSQYKAKKFMLGVNLRFSLISFLNWEEE